MGRPPVTSHAALEQVGIELFATRGFERTSVDDIAEAAGVSRRTFFQDFPAKADVVWGDFDVAVERLRSHLAAMPADIGLMEAIRRAVVRFNHLEPAQRDPHRRRMTLILDPAPAWRPACGSRFDHARSFGGSRSRDGTVAVASTLQAAPTRNGAAGRPSDAARAVPAGGAAAPAIPHAVKIRP